MATHRTPSTGSTEKPRIESDENIKYNPSSDPEQYDERDPEAKLADMHHNLERGLKARHITMIAIGGAIGTGLIIGT